MLRFSFAVIALILIAQTSFASQPEYNFKTLASFAKLSSAAYQHEPKIKALCDELGYTLDYSATTLEAEVFYFMATDEVNRIHLVSVRGTASPVNIMVDADIQLQIDKLTGQRMHLGFAQPAQIIYKKLKQKFKPGYKIQTTGHSLGGAVAMILAMYLDKEKYIVDRVVTFGQPKVTNITGSQRFQHLNILRVVTPKDVVPLLPPLDPVNIRNLDIYWHVGDELILYHGDRYSVTGGIPAMLRAANFFTTRPGQENFSHHQMAFYLERVEEKQHESLKVPFKNDINLLNIFSSE